MCLPVGGRIGCGFLAFFAIFFVLNDWQVDGGGGKTPCHRLVGIVRWAVRVYLDQGVAQSQDQSCVQSGLAPNLPQFSGPLRSSV
uniref:Uncharacterized protein n=1 Tax=uncultured planctomycete 6N14 TaxID=455069 RepID=A9LGU8_9BACT|nr:hypothetical protein 6N14_26 [uncultured planctomycete 6N14]